MNFSKIHRIKVNYLPETGLTDLSADVEILIFINCNWVVTRWQWLFYMYTKHEIGYY